MSDFFEIDFLNVESKKSGDAIPMRYSVDGKIRIHVTDGGYLDTGDKLINHINTHYGSPSSIDAVIVTHQDGDHTGGLRKLFDQYKINELWMLRPWLYADELIERFSRFRSVENLANRLKELYPNIVTLEELANEYKVPILEPFQGAKIGHFTVMAPSKALYLDLVVDSDKTPDASKSESQSLAKSFSSFIESSIEFIRSAWGVESFPDGDTSAENNMSVIQYANIRGEKILLTGDAGRLALQEAADYAPSVGLELPGIDRIQIPHHGSRHNVSTEILNTWLGPKLNSQNENFTAVVSASQDDEHHPRKSVIRAFIHRGAKVISTETGDKCMRSNSPNRDGWTTAEPVQYPQEQEN